MLPALLFFASLVADVRGFVDRNDLATAERVARSYKSKTGETPEYAAALSWVARGALKANQWEQADRLSTETRELTLRLLKTRKLDSEPWLPVALGAAIEVHAQALAGLGRRDEAVGFLREQIAAYRSTSLHERISKNLNLLSLEGQPAPPLDSREWLGPIPPTLARLRGRPVLLFFWAHWCADCKGMVPILSSIMRNYGPRGLALVAPTRRFGYVAGGEEAGPAVEKPYIDKVRRQYYAELGDMPTPVSAANFQVYGSSSTPTLVLIDRAGKVRYYHPGAVSEPELAAAIQKVIAN